MEKNYLLLCGKLFDGIHDVLQENMQVWVQGNRIRKVGGNLTVKGDYQVIDLRKCTVTPGMIDAHVHLSYFNWKGKPTEIIQAQLAEIGITANIELMERAAYLEETQTECNYELTFYVITNNISDPDYICTRRFHTSMEGGGNNFTLHKVEGLDELIDAARPVFRRSTRNIPTFHNNPFQPFLPQHL